MQGDRGFDVGVSRDPIMLYPDFRNAQRRTAAAELLLAPASRPVAVPIEVFAGERRPVRERGAVEIVQYAFGHVLVERSFVVFGTVNQTEAVFRGETEFAVRIFQQHHFTQAVAVEVTTFDAVGGIGVIAPRTAFIAGASRHAVRTIGITAGHDV